MTVEIEKIQPLTPSDEPFKGPPAFYVRYSSNNEVLRLKKIIAELNAERQVK